MRRLLSIVAALVALPLSANPLLQLVGSPSAPPTFVVAGTAAANADGSDLTPSLGAHQANDILLVMVRTQKSATVSTATSGWELLANDGGLDNLRQIAWYWKRAESGSETNPTFSGGVNTYLFYAQSYVIRGATTSDSPFVDSTIKYTNDDATPDSSEITATVSNSLVLCFGAVINDDAWTTSPPPIGWTLGDDITTTVGADARFFVIHRSTAAGTVAAVEIGAFGVAQWIVTHTVAIIP